MFRSFVRFCKERRRHTTEQWGTAAARQCVRPRGVGWASNIRKELLPGQSCLVLPDAGIGKAAALVVLPLTAGFTVDRARA